MTGDRLDHSVRDEGCGFDLKELRQNEGLGIRSMKERATCWAEIRDLFGNWKGDNA